MLRTRTVLALAIGLTLLGVPMVGWEAFRAAGAAEVRPVIQWASGADQAAERQAAERARQERERQERARKEAALTSALDNIAAAAPDFAVAVVDNTTGRTYSYRGNERFETASVVKVDILAALLLAAQDRDRQLTANDRTLAARMITVSDNDAASRLFDRVGGVSGLTRANKRLGLTRTVVDPSWGLTRTTAEDQARLLGVLVDPDGPLDARSRKLALQLLGSVADDQRWGASAAAQATERVEVKNGWLSRDSEGGRWIANSVGRVSGGSVDLSVAVLSHGNRSFDAGVQLVERVAEVARQQLPW